MRFSRKTFKIKSVQVALILLISCTINWMTEEFGYFNQIVIISIANDGVPIEKMVVKITDSFLRKDCSQDGIVGFSGPDGKFRTTRKKNRRIITNSFQVFVHSDTLCVRVDNQWKVLWSGLYGEEVEKVLWFCDLNKPYKNEWSQDLEDCRMDVSRTR